MPSQDGAPPQIYIPTLRKELIGRLLPDGVLLMDPGLPQTGCPDRLYTPPDYPLSREEAARTLSELLSMGEALDLANPKNADLARADLARADLTANALSPEEARDLANFAAQTGTGVAHIPSPRIAAQKVLLLAWDLETRLTEIAALRREVEQTARPLADALRDPTSDADSAGFLQGIPDTAEPDWRPTLAAMAAFLPEDAFLITAHDGIRNALLELGMLLPLPEDTAQKLPNWPDPAKTAMLWTKAPLWRILGHAKPPENAPWLSKAPEIIVCSPNKKRPA